MLAETTFHRQLDILPPDNAKKAITLIGCGGIGSVTTIALAKVGFENLSIYDDDIVEDHNLPSQFFFIGDKDKNKGEAVSNITDLLAHIKPAIHSYKWNEEHHSFSPIMISAVDSMNARKEIWPLIKNKLEVELYIDARMSAESMRIYCINPIDPDDQTFYEAQLYDDSEANEELCTAKAIAYNTFVIGGIVASLVKKHVMQQPKPKEFIFDLQTYGLYRPELT
jgi:hypothetical protein